MDRNTILTKTGKGMREATGKTHDLPREARALLDAIDGKSSIEHLLARLAGRSPATVEELVEQLAADGYIRERITRAADPPAPPAGDEGGIDLDFTSPEWQAAMRAEDARRETEAMARRKAEETARRWAAIRDERRAAKREAEKRARSDAAEKAQAEAQARRAAAEQALREAAQRQQREAEAQARHLAAERARQAAEEQRRREADEQARREAAERLRRAAAEAAQREAEAQARRDAEERAQREAAEAARREADEQARREAAERLRRAAAEAAQREAEAQARRDAEERAQREAAEAARREAEEQAQREAEAQARRDAEERARREAAEAAEAAQREAEQAARREAAARIAQEVAAQAVRAAADRMQREAEEQASLAAAAQVEREAAARAEQQARERAQQELEQLAQADERARRAAEKRARREARKRSAHRTEPPTEARPAAPIAAVRLLRRPIRWRKPLAWGLACLLLLGGIGLHLVPFNNRIAGFEQAAAVQFARPVRVAAVHLSLLPQPHWRLDGVVIGSGGQIRIPTVRMIAALDSLFDDSPVFTAMELDAPRIDSEGLAWLLFGQPGARGIAAGHVDAQNAVLELPPFSLPGLDATMEVGADGRWRSIVAAAPDHAISLELRPGGDTVQVAASARELALPFAAAPRLTEVRAAGSADRNGLYLTAFEGHVLGGRVDGSARLAWGAALRLEGELRAQRIDAAQLYPELLEDGRLELTASFAVPIGAADQAAARLAGRFAIRNGTLRGVDMGSVLKNIGTGGRTRFAGLDGAVVIDGGAAQLRELHLDAGAMSAAGTADLAADGSLRGQVAIALALAGQRHHASLDLGGSFKPPWGRDIRWLRRPGGR